MNKGFKTFNYEYYKKIIKNFMSFYYKINIKAFRAQIYT